LGNAAIIFKNLARFFPEIAIELLEGRIALLAAACSIATNE
jgi:hypothetical protein